MISYGDQKENKNYYVVRNAGGTRSRYFLNFFNESINE